MVLAVTGLYWSQAADTMVFVLRAAVEIFRHSEA